jgi:hypothetical protein
VLAPAAIGACLVLAGLGWAVSRRRVLSGLVGTAVLPIATWAETRALPAAGLAAVTAAIVLIAHRSHWRSSPPSPSQE